MAEAALVIASLISAGTSVAVADRNRRATNRARDKQNALQARKQKEAERAEHQQQLQERQLARNQQAVAQATARQARNQSLQQKGIAPIARDLSNAILDDAGQR